MCYVLEMLDRGISLPYELVYVVVEFLEHYLKSNDSLSHWSNPEKVIKAYTIVLNKLKLLLKKELDEDNNDIYYRSTYIGNICSKGFLIEVANQLYLEQAESQDVVKWNRMSNSEKAKIFDEVNEINKRVKQLF